MSKNNEKTSVFANGLIWFGAAASIAEIMTGTLFAPLGFAKGIAAIIIGHVIGCALMYGAGLIGGKTGKNAMQTVQMSFGSRGALIFAILNVMQLVGWTAVMIFSGAQATAAIANPGLGINGIGLWCVVIGVLIIVWIIIGIKNLSKLNVVAMSLLFIITVILSSIVFRGGGQGAPVGGALTFGAAVELSVAMPLSWLPLISDYTKDAAKPKAATFASVAVYFAASCWMYIIGLGATLFFGESDLATIIIQAGIGVAGIIIVIISTVTTTFLDAHSAGVSTTVIQKKSNEKLVAVIVTIVGVLLAAFSPITRYESFLYLISSVFAPMVAILITDFFILKQNAEDRAFNLTNIILWVIGFIIYRLFMNVDTVIGSTVPVMIIIGLISVLVKKGKALICFKKS